jgi:hypothetical protein
MISRYLGAANVTRGRLMSEYHFKEEARLIAIEYLLMNLYKFLYRTLNHSPEKILAGHQMAREMLRQQTFPGFDAAESDLLSAEVQASVETLLGGIEEMLGLVKK